MVLPSLSSSGRGLVELLSHYGHSLPRRPRRPPPPHLCLADSGNKSAPLVAQFQSNLGIVQAAVQTGRGALDGYKSCAYQGIPVSEHFGLTGRGFKAVADVLGKSLERVAAQSCREEVAEEIALT
jgi:hypothetical protein